MGNPFIFVPKEEEGQNSLVTTPRIGSNPFKILPEANQNENNLDTTPRVGGNPFVILPKINTETDPLGDQDANPQSDSLTSQTPDFSTEQTPVQDQTIVEDRPVFQTPVQEGVKPDRVSPITGLTFDQELDIKGLENRAQELNQQRIKTILDQPGPTAEKAELFDIQNPSVTNVEQGKSGQFFRTDVPFIGFKKVSDLEAAIEIDRANKFVRRNNAFNRGLGRLKQSFNVLQQQVGLKSPKDFVLNMMELDRVYPDAPANIQAGLKEVTDAKTFAEALTAIVRNPGAVASVVGESLAVSVPSLASFVATTFATGNPILGAGAGGVITYGTIFGDIISEEIKSSGVEVTDEQGMIELMADKDFFKRARLRANAYGIPIAIFDALSMGLAGKIVGQGIKQGASALNIGSRAGAETLLQGILGGLGETAGQLSEMKIGEMAGFNFREAFGVGDITLETFSEFPIAPAEIGTNVASARSEIQQNKADERQSQIDAVTALQGTPEKTFVQQPVVPESEKTAEQKISENIEAKRKQQKAPALEVDNPQNVPAESQIGIAINAISGSEEKSSVQVPSGEKSYNTEFVLVDINQLKQSSGKLQPRDRDRKESKILAIQRANPETFNAKRLMESPTTGDGSPIVARDGTIISGNGRVLTLQEVYADQDQAVANYKTELESFLSNKLSKDLGVSETDPRVKADVDRILNNYQQPVLVRRLTDDLNMDSLVELADLSNRSEQAQMSVTESASRDATAMGNDVIKLFAGGDVTSNDNKAFVSAFVNKVLTKTEQGQFTKDGQLTKQAVDRMKGAILASAFTDVDTLSIMLESADNNIKALSNALVTAAPKFSQLKSSIADGNVKPEFDVSDSITNTAQLLTQLRNQKIKPGEYFAQQDLIADKDPMVEALVKAFYNDELTRAKSQQYMEAVLDYYVEETQKVAQTDQLFASDVTPVDVIGSAKKRADREKSNEQEGQEQLFGTKGDEQRSQEGSEQVQGAERKRGSDDTGSVDTEPKTTEKEKGLNKETPSEKGVVTDLVSEKEVRDFVTDELRKIVPESEVANYLDQLKFSTRRTDFMENVYDRANPYRNSFMDNATDILDRSDFKNTPDGKSSVANTRRRKARIFIENTDELGLKLHNINEKLDKMGFVEAIDEAQRTKLFNKGRGIATDAEPQGELIADTTTREESQDDPILDQEAKRFTTSRQEAVGSTRGSTEGTIIYKEMQTLRQSVFQQAFRDAGLDPDEASNLSIGNQFRVLSKLMKDKFGFTFVEKGDISSYNAVQSLLDAYRNLQFMAHSLQLPNSSMSLEGEVGLILPTNANQYNAAYMPKAEGVKQSFQEQDVKAVEAPAIIMPARSNSFAHEWGHALDWYIMERMSPDWHQGITGRIKGMGENPKPWMDTAPKEIKQAFADLMNAMFFDKAEFSARIMDIEQKIGKLEVKKRTPAQDKELETLRERLRKAVEEGSARLKVKKSQYKVDTETFSKAKYWSKPTEMFARAFEAYVSHQITAREGTTEFVSKSDEAYQLTKDQVKGADERLALTYPKDETRDNIFLAMDRLLEAIRGQFSLEVADRPGDYDMIDQRLDFAGQISAGMDKSFVKEIMASGEREHRKAKIHAKKQEERPIRFEDLGTGIGAKVKRKYRALEDQVLNNVLFTKRGILFRLADRYGKHPELNRKREAQINKELRNPDISEDQKRTLRSEKAFLGKNNKQKIRQNIENIISRVATDPGGKRKTIDGGIFEERVKKEGRRYSTRFKQIIDEFGVDTFSKEEMEQLRLLMTDNTTANVPQKVRRAAGEIRNKILNPLYDYARKSGLNVKYLEDGAYLPRVLDKVLVFGKEKDFMYGDGDKDNPSMTRGAYGLYHQVIWNNEVGDLNVGDIEGAERLVDLSNRKILRKQIKKNTDLKANLDRLQKAIQEIKSDQALIERTEGNTDSIEQRILENQQVIEEIHEDIYTQLRPIFAETAAQDWLNRLHTASSGQEMEAHSVQNTFMRQRKLPKEADSFMMDFYLDPVDAVSTYIPSVIRKAETENLFGTKLVPKGQRLDENGKTKNYLDHLLAESRQLGMDKQDADMIEIIVNTVLGRTAGVKNKGFLKAANYVHAYGSMALLPRAVMSSIAEPLTIGINTGSSFKAIQNFVNVFDEAVALVRPFSKERTLFFRQMSNILGVIDEPTVGEMVANRLGGSVMEDPQLNARVNRFFVRTKLQGLTNAQRRSSMRVWLQYMAELSHEYRNIETKPEKIRTIKNIFQDLGINEESIDQFTSFMAESKDDKFKAPSIDDIMEANGELSDMGELLAIATQRGVSMTIQDPNIIDRPLYAEHPIGRLVFGIQSFMNAFTRNVLIASAKKVARETRENGVASGASMLGLQMLPTFATFYGGHFLISTAREFLFNSDAIERERENDNLALYLLEIATLRSGLTGKFDPFINMFKSLRYEADLKTVIVGASVSFYMRALQRIFGLAVGNSENTVAAEYQAVRGVWDLLATSLISHAVSRSGVGAIGGTALGLGAIYLSSPEFKHYVIREFIKFAYGEEYYPGRRKQKKSWAE